LLHLRGEASELNGDVVTPATAPAGFTGSLMLKSGGAVNFTPAQSGDGVYFQGCCSNSANAYYQFSGPTVGSIFNVHQGEVSFYLKSRYSFAQRQSSATQSRYAFDVRDDDPSNHVFYFLTRIASG